MSVDLLAAFLKTVGAFETRHSGRTLGEHLLGTYALLADAGCDEETCLGGGLHSIYGTKRFQHVTIAWEDEHSRVETLFGMRAQDLAALFSYKSTAQIEAGNTINRFYKVPLMLIAAANILEQGGTLDRWPRIKAVWDAQCERSDAEPVPT